MSENRHDQQTYARATTAALLGLATQAGLALALLVLGLWSSLWPFGRGQALLAAAWFAAGGIPIWACLWIIFQQHRLALLEKLETEELVKTRSEGALFEGAAEALMIAERRLTQLYRWGLPATSLLLVAYLLASVAFQALVTPEAWTTTDDAPFARWPAPTQPSVLLAALAGLTFAGFVISRYLAGMARVDAWQLLRGGAAYLTGTTALIAGLVGGAVIGHFELAGIGLRVMAVAVPVLSVLLAIEVSLNFVLGIYRPRRAGEAPRAAFDSRLLALVAAPGNLAKTINEAVNYQVGFEITRSWFWQLLGRWTVPLIGAGVGLFLLQSALVVVRPHEQALITRLGRIRGAPLQPGLHLKAPWPLEQATLYDVSRLREIVVGSHGRPDEGDSHGAQEWAGKGPKPILWTNRHASEEKLLMVAPPQDLRADGSDAGRTPSVSLVGNEIYVHYRIRDLVGYVSGSRDPEQRFAQMVERAVASRLLRHELDTWLQGDTRAAAADAIALALQAEVDAADPPLGLEVVWVGMTGLHPPQEVAPSFHDVIGAQQEKEIDEQQARLEETETLADVAGSVGRAREIVNRIAALEALRRERPALPEAKAEHRRQLAEREGQIEALLADAGGEAAKRIALARAYRWQKEQSERAKAERFLPQLKAYKLAPTVYTARRYLEVLAQGLERARKYVLVTDRDNMTLRFDFKEDESVGVLEAVEKR